MKKIAGILIAACLCLAAPVRGAEIGFVEDFSLAEDRSLPLKQLVPGTEDYYFYQCLDHLNNGQFEEVDKLLTPWVKRYDRTPRVVEVENRLALLRYDKNHAATLEYIRRQLGVLFNHQKEVLNQKPNLPTRLDPAQITRETLAKRALAQHPDTVDGFEDAALDWLAAEKLDPARTHRLLTRLARPDYPNLVSLILDNLQYKESGGFGSLPIHSLLTLPQLEECLQKRPALLNETRFVQIYLSRLRPNDDVDWGADASERGAYHDRLWAFVSKLNPSHNSLKAHLLYHRLAHDRALGVWDKERFLTYLRLPRPVPYINPKYLEKPELVPYRADLGADFNPQTLLSPVGNDEPLVREYLQHFFAAEDTWEPYAEFVRDVYLKECFAETKIVTGQGDMEKWYSMLPPAGYQALKERVDIDFAPANKEFFAADEPVGLDLYVKNVEKLIVKIYEINTPNFYKENQREIDTSINLDGLVTNEEKVHPYSADPFRRELRHFDLPSLNKRGVYVAEFIGNGKSSRALIHKGRLRFLERTGAAGQVFTVVNEKNEKVPKAHIWIAGHEYTADEKNGTVLVPFSTNPGRQPILLMEGDFASLDFFQHQAESYEFTAGIYVDRESLISRGGAVAVIRPTLKLNGVPVSLDLLKQPVLEIRTEDHDGIVTSKEVRDFAFRDDRETTVSFQIPDRLATVILTVKAKVESLTGHKEQDLADSQAFRLNEIDRTEKLENLLLGRIGTDYVLDLLGKNGEPRSDRPVQFTIKHRDFRDQVHAVLQTDPKGRIVLGPLDQIEWVEAAGPEGVKTQWTLPSSRHSYPSSVHAAAGEPLYLPYMGKEKEATRAEFSLLEKRGEAYVQDRFEALAIDNGFLRISDLPAGDYDLFIKPNLARITVRLAGKHQDLEPSRAAGSVLAANRCLELRNTKPLQIVSVESGADKLRLRLMNTSEYTRVHVFATRYLPAYPAYDCLAKAPFPEPRFQSVPKAKSLYISGRDIGDEFLYILDRRYAQKFPGNMLDRPGILLNPWAVRKTETGTQEAKAGEEYAAKSAPSETQAGARPAGAVEVAGFKDFFSLDFLPESSSALLNLVPDADGTITIDRKILGDHPFVRVVAMDPANVASRDAALEGASPEPKPRDLRLAKGLEPDKHYTEQKQVSPAGADSPFVLPDITTSKMETYGSLAEVYRLFVTLNPDQSLVEFRFLLDWPKMKPEEKREKYSKYASHELHFFLYRKDPKFFNDAVLPYLQNKKDKTFLDEWLIAAASQKGKDTLAGYVKPWRHGQMSLAEQILLAQALPDETVSTARLVRERWELLPPDVDRFNHLFDTALKGRALETRGGAGAAGSAGFAANLLARDVNGAVVNEALGVEVAAATELSAGGLVRGEDAKRLGTARALAAGKPPAAPAAAAMPAPSAELMKKDLAKEKGEPRALKESEKVTELTRGAGAGGGRAPIIKTLPTIVIGDEEKGTLEGVAQRDLRRYERQREFYQQVDQTEEFAENNYYKRPLDFPVGDLFPVNAFWKDYAAWDGKGGFVSTHLAEATGNFTEMVFALAVLDLPFEPPKHKAEMQDTRLTFTPAGPVVIFHQEIREAKTDEKDKFPILVNQNFFRQSDRYRHENNQRYDKFVSDEFLTGVVYGCQIVITNPTSSPRKLDALLQIPRGAIPALKTRYTRGVHLDLQPYNTQTLEYYFYFPQPGEFPHFPVHVASNENLVAFTQPFVFRAVVEPTRIDKTSWDYISQHGTEDQVVEFLNTNNVHRVNLDRIAWRMQDKAFFQKTLDLLSRRHVYAHTLWSYGLKHDDPAAIREFLQNCGDFLAACGAYLESPLVTIDPVVRKTYEHLEYSPLANARAHRLGKKREIVNERVLQQYQRLMEILRYKKTLGDDDLMAVTYYMLLQDRIEEALRFFGRVNPKNLQTALQYDYFAAYLAFCKEDFKAARAVADRYKDYPVDRWKKTFAALSSQLDEIEGKAGGALVDEKNRLERQTLLAAAEPSLDFKVESRKIILQYRNLKDCRVNYYLMDIELLFSRNPFVQEFAGQFSSIRPNETQLLTLEKTTQSTSSTLSAAQTPETPGAPPSKTFTFDLPERFRSSNVMVEIVAGGIRKSQAYYANDLNVQLIENYGQVKVTHAQTGKALSKAYVKVYGRMQGGEVRFYKDGYTDPRGIFDYASLSAGGLDRVEKFSLLVLSEKDGAVVREAAPPKR